MNGTPPLHPAVSAFQPSTPVPIAEPKNRIALLPETLISLIADDLPVAEQRLFARASTCTNRSMQAYFRRRLKPDFRITDNPMAAYRDPGMRLDRYVPEDKAGRKYLQELCINHYMARQIAGGKVTIPEALQILAKNWEAIEAAKKSHADIDFMLSRHRDSVGCLYYVECGLMTVQQYLAMDDNGIAALRHDGVEKYLASGDLLPEQLNAMGEWACLVLCFPGIQQAIARHEITVDQVAAIKNPRVSNFLLFGANKYLDHGLLSLEQAGQLTTVDFEDLKLPAVQHYLDTGKMTMSQMLALKSADRRELTM